MSKEFIPYEQALELKELGFNVQYFGEYFEMDGEKYIVDDKHAEDGWWLEYAEELNVNAVLYQQAFRWFREKYELVSWVSFGSQNSREYIFGILTDSTFIGNYNTNFSTYEEAELACLKKLIEIVKIKPQKQGRIQDISIG